MVQLFENTDFRNRLGKRGREKVLQSYSLEGMIRETEKTALGGCARERNSVEEG